LPIASFTADLASVISSKTIVVKKFFVAPQVYHFTHFIYSFKAIQLENQTPECNDFYTVLQYYSELDKDSAFIGTVYNECKNSRENAKQKKIEKLCGDLYTDKNEYMKCVK